jgi:hypothetical protein
MFYRNPRTATRSSSSNAPYPSPLVSGSRPPSSADTRSESSERTLGWVETQVDSCSFRPDRPSSPSSSPRHNPTPPLTRSNSLRSDALSVASCASVQIPRGRPIHNRSRSGPVLSSHHHHPHHYPVSSSPLSRPALPLRSPSDVSTASRPARLQPQPCQPVVAISPPWIWGDMYVDTLHNSRTSARTVPGHRHSS